VIDKFQFKVHVLHRVGEQRDVLQTIQRKKAKCVRHTLRRNCHIKHVNEGNIHKK
jgi:hypothetical protein